jgi:hypothetical protein
MVTNTLNNILILILRIIIGYAGVRAGVRGRTAGRHLHFPQWKRYTF